LGPERPQPGGAVDALKRHGLLLESDPNLPSVVSLVIGRPIKGGWWGHPSGGAIYAEANRLADRPDVLLVKLLGGKVTFVARELWPHLLTIGRSREPWQLEGLAGEALALLDLVRRNGIVRTDDPAVRRAVNPKKPAQVALELERRLLVLGMQVHTQTGAHAKTLEAWDHWARRKRLAGRLPVARAKAALEDRVRRLNAEFHGKARLPWPSGAPR
jgi:hypothetical protein